MKSLLSIVVIFLFISNANSQEDSNELSFISYWSTGDSYDFKISKISEEWKEGKLKKKTESGYLANFTVLDSTDTSYTIKWTYENNLKKNYNIPSDLAKRFSKYKITEIKYKTSEVGDFQEVLNWKEISDMMSDLFSDMIEVLGAASKEKKETLKTSLAPLVEAYKTKEGIESLVLKELQYFHFPLGLVFDISEPILYDDELPNLFGGKPIKAKGKLTFEDIDRDNGFCVIKQELKLDEADTKKMLKNVLKNFGLKDREFKKALKEAVFKIEDKNSYEYYFNPGIPHNIEISREVVFNLENKKGKKVNITRIELLYNESEGDVASENEDVVVKTDEVENTSVFREKLIGKWVGEDDNKVGSLSFDAEGHAILEMKGQILGGKEFIFQGERGSVTYEMNDITDPIFLDLIITKLDTEENMKLPCILEFIDDNTIQFAIGFGNRPTKFGAENSVILKREK